MNKSPFVILACAAIVLLAVFMWPDPKGTDPPAGNNSPAGIHNSTPDLAQPDEGQPGADPLAEADENPDKGEEQRSSALGFEAADGELVFLDEEGKRVPIKRAWLFRRGKGKKHSYGRGPVLSIPCPEECGSAAAVIAIVVDHVPFFGWVERGEGPIVVTLPRGQILAGTSRTEGRPRQEALHLRVSLESQMPQVGTEQFKLRQHFPPDLRDSLDWSMEYALAEIPFDGNFLLQGLAENWHGEISLHTYRYEVQGLEGRRGDPWWKLTLEQPRQDLDLVFLEYQRIYGRLIHADRSPCTHVWDIDLYWSEQWKRAQRPTGEPGSFEVYTHEVPDDPVAIQVNHGGSTFELDPILPAADGNLGLIALPESRSLSFQVINQAGAGIPKVEYLVEDSNRWMVSDAEGRALEQLGSKQNSITFNAEGYRPQIEAIPPAPASTATFVLTSDRGYRIHLRPNAAFWKSHGFDEVPKASTDLPDIKVVIECAEGLLSEAWSSDLQWLMLENFDSSHSRRGKLTQAISEEGVPRLLTARGLDPQGPVTLKVEDREVVVYEQVLPPLPESGLIDVEVALGGTSGEKLEVLVVGEDGVGIQGAKVVLKCKDTRYNGFADQYGLAVFDALPSTEVSVRVGAYGYVSVDQGVLFLPLGNPYRVTLKKGHVLELYVNQADGSPASDVDVRAEISGTDLRLNLGEVRPGVYAIQGVPDQMLDILVSVGNWNIPYQIDGTQTSTTIEIPPLYPVTFEVDLKRRLKTPRFYLQVTQGEVQAYAEVMPAQNRFRRQPLLLPMGNYQVTLVVSEESQSRIPVPGLPVLDVTVAGGPVHLDFR